VTTLTAAAVLTSAACSTSTPAPSILDSPSVASSATSPTPTTLTPTEEWAAAEKAYRQYVASFAKAYPHLDVSKLDKTVATPGYLAAQAKEFKRLRDAGWLKDGKTLRWRQDIKSIQVPEYAYGRLVSLRVCAITIFRHIDKHGNDVTTDRAGKKLPPESEQPPFSHIIPMVSTDDGKTWKVRAFYPSSEGGYTCAD
jgi:hypothetical protein